MAKGEPGRAQAHPNVGCTVLANTQYTLIEQSLILLMYYYSSLSIFLLH